MIDYEIRMRCDNCWKLSGRLEPMNAVWLCPRCHKQQVKRFLPQIMQDFADSLHEEFVGESAFD